MISPDRCAIFLDVDGILSEMDASAGASAPSRLTLLVQQARAATQHALALVSGHDLSSVDRVFGLPECDAIGSHGAEVRQHGLVANPNDVFDEEAIHIIAERISFTTKGTRGILVEQKPCSIALHYSPRLVSGDLVCGLVGSAIANLDDVVDIIPRDKAVEVVPKQATKGSGLTAFMRTLPYLGRRPILVRNGAMEANTLAAVKALGGLSFCVRSGADTGTGNVFAANAMSAWLERICAGRVGALPPA